jgi:hypothetical protein
LCKYALLPATVNVLETFLTAIFASLFMSSKASLIISVSSNSAAPSLLISVEGTGKNQLETSQENMRSPDLSLCSLLIYSSPKPSSLLEHCREGETSSSLPNFHGISFWTLQ